MHPRASAASLRALLPEPWRHELSADELVEFIAEALAQNGIFESEETRLKRVPQIAVFVAHCAPRSASASGLRLAAEFLFAFFALNDHWESTRAVLRPASTVEGPGARWIRAWLERLAAAPGAHAQRFRAAFERYLQSLQQEHTYEGLPGHPTFDEYVDVARGRYQWVATAPYIELWELSLGLVLDGPARHRAEPLKALAVELTYLANDIGSLARDKAGKNYVTLLMQRDPSLTTLESAVEASARIYADKARSLINERLAIESGTELARYAEVVCDITDGNLRATTLLARASAEGRYSPLARECLSKLPLVSAG
jgi:hypothetical protein